MTCAVMALIVLVVVVFDMLSQPAAEEGAVMPARYAVYYAPSAGDARIRR